MTAPKRNWRGLDSVERGERGATDLEEPQAEDDGLHGGGGGGTRLGVREGDQLGFGWVVGGGR
jgi:hypothetical protein